MMLCVILNEDVSLCPEVQSAGSQSRQTEICSNTSHTYIGILTKPNCFRLHHWLKDFIELLLMERAASALQGLCSDDGLAGPWTLIKDYINKSHLV